MNKSWLSTTAATALLLSLIAKIKAEQPITENAVEIGKPVFDANVFSLKSDSSESHHFSAEVHRLLEILSHSVYTKSDAAVREMISNAIDALDKQHEYRLANGDTQDNISDYKITVSVDQDNGILAIRDNGCGMTAEEMKTYLGTIAKSGTAEYSSGKKAPDAATLIGQFGVGFYSSRLIADEVVVISKSDKDADQHIWKMETSSSFRVVKDPAGNTLGRGTSVLLKIKPESTEFLDHENLEKIIKEYFGYDRHGIFLVKPKTTYEEVPIEGEEAAEKEPAEEKKVEDDGVEVEEEKKEEDGESKPKTRTVGKTTYEEVLMSQSAKPIWLRPPSEVQHEEYVALYKTLSGKSSGEPLAYTHFVSETANSESFRTILFIPERPPFSPFSSQEHTVDIKLHVRGVFVTAKFDDFIPKYLSFVTGIMDSNDLSLNVSRDILQNTKELRGIKKKVIKKIIEMMSDLAQDEEKYKKFYEAYGSFLKMEIAEHEDYRTLLGKLLRYKSTKSEDKLVSLEQYIEQMPQAQKDKKVIYFLAGKSNELKKSPFLGRFESRGYEVLLMTEPVDEHMIQKMDSFEEFKFVNIAKDGLKLDETEEEIAKKYEESYKDAKKWISESLKASIEKVVFVDGPADIPGTIKSSQYGWSGNMERLIMAQTSDESADPMLKFFAQQKKIMELNPQNAIVKEILERANSGKTDDNLKSILRTLAQSMTIASGYTIKDTASFSRGIDRLARQVLGIAVEPLAEEPVEAEKHPGGFNSEDLSLEKISEELARMEKEKKENGEVNEDEEINIDNNAEENTDNAAVESDKEEL